MLSFIDPAAAFAHLPYGVRHDSGRPSAYGDERLRSARETRVSELLYAVTRSRASSTWATEPAEIGFARWGMACGELGAIAPRDFSAFVCDLLLGGRCRQNSRLEADLAALPTCPDYYRAAFDEYQRTFRASAADRAFLLPMEFRDGGAIDDGFARLPAYVGRFECP